jgi:outer membrane protein OmpA-like peptidoglycan-associated protein
LYIRHSKLNQLMNFNLKALLTAFAFSAFAAFCFWWWNSRQKECCGGTIPTTTSTTSNLPLSFNWNSNEAIQGTRFTAYHDEQIKNLGPTDTLVIKTWYYEGEPKGQQVAIERAEAIKALYPTVDLGRIKVITEMRPVDEKYKTEKFEAAQFDIIKNKNSLVKIDGNKIIIYFATNSKAKQLEKEIDDYLNTLSANMKANPAITVSASGHTDNVGDDAKNLSLSQGRAEFVKAAIIQKGIDAAKVTATGKGETEPLADNKDEEGRKLNRRVELIINNQ